MEQPKRRHETPASPSIFSTPPLPPEAEAGGHRVPRSDVAPRIDPGRRQTRVIINRPIKRRTFLERLVTLDSWGHTLFSTRVQDGMALAYLILGVIFVFELLAWSLLFNFVFYGGKFGAGWLTLPAIGLGLLWGLGIFAIDKSVITADLTRPGFGKWWGFFGRALLVAASALLTAQPIHQLFFKSQIEERIKDETLRAEAVAQNDRYQRERAELEKNNALAPVPEEARRQRREAEAQKDQADNDVRQAEQAVIRREGEFQGALAERDQRLSVLRRFRANGDEEAARAAESRFDAQEAVVARARTLLDDARAARDNVRNEADKAERARERALKLYGEDVDRSDKDRKGKYDDAKKRRAAYETAMDRLRSANFGDTVLDVSGQPVRWGNDGFIDREQILWQLIDGQPARWPPGVPPEKQAEIATWAGMPMPSIAAAEAANSIRIPALGLFLIAGAIPLLSIAFKLLMSEELKTYYSLEAQARSGNQEALQQLESRALPRPSSYPARRGTPGQRDSTHYG
jgi:hypothetical protein